MSGEDLDAGESSDYQEKWLRFVFGIAAIERVLYRQSSVRGE